MNINALEISERRMSATNILVRQIQGRDGRVEESTFADENDPSVRGERDVHRSREGNASK